MKTAKPTSNKPKPVTHHALSDLAMEAFAQTRVATREQAKGVIAKAQERLHKACVAELKTSVRGRAMLAMGPDWEIIRQVCCEDRRVFSPRLLPALDRLADWRGIA